MSARQLPPSAEVNPSATPDSESISPESGSISGSGLAEIVDLTKLDPVACPCGTARRGFADRKDFPGTVHLTEISASARPHFHRQQTEVYVILDCSHDAAIELDGSLHQVAPMSAILIPPGVVHRAVGEMRVLIFCTPKFDPSDEFFPEAAGTETI